MSEKLQPVGQGELSSALESAFHFRRSQGLLDSFLLKQRPTRLFHGLNDRSKDYRVGLSPFSVDCFWFEEGCCGVWVTSHEELSSDTLTGISSYYQGLGVSFGVVTHRQSKFALGHEPVKPIILFGDPPLGRVEVEEPGGLKFLVEFQGGRHPGLFLDHYPLRQRLLEISKSKRVLNTFSYTGSLSVAAAVGQAAQVTTVDLSKPTIEWAKQNMQINLVNNTNHEFYAADVFEFLKRAEKKKNLFDIVILDPPSFSRSKYGTFSTKKDLVKLHTLALRVLQPGGTLISSINTESVPRSEFEMHLQKAVAELHRTLEIIAPISLPGTFPEPAARSYLKGLIAKIS